MPSKFLVHVIRWKVKSLKITKENIKGNFHNETGKDEGGVHGRFKRNILFSIKIP